MNYTIAVRSLCEFTAKRGDLDLRFTPAPSAQEGIAGHQLVTSRRGPDYRAELSLSGQYRELLVRGRADGYDPVQNQLEEIKTFRGDIDAIAENHRYLHWAQVKIYGHLLCQERGLSDVRLALVYFDIGSQQESLLCETLDADALRQFFEQQCAAFLQWAGQELAHRLERDRQLAVLRFPHPAFRPGQRDLAEAVYKTARKGRCLLAQAPTGIGKTIATVFPLLKAAPDQKLDKLLFLTAKTPGRKLALDALRLIKGGAPELPLRVLELVAREKACEHPDKACHGQSCPLAQGFYDRLPAARSAALALDLLDKDALRQVAREQRVCPYYLSQEMARWADVIIGDYNYYFDISALLYSLRVVDQWRVGVLVDEAHNLLERARKMYSAELDQIAFKLLRRFSPPDLKKALDRLNRNWNALLKDQSGQCAENQASQEPVGKDQAAYRNFDSAPSKFVNALQQTCSAIADHFCANPPHAAQQTDHRLQNFYFDALHFTRVAEIFATLPANHGCFDISTQPGGSVLCLRNIVPATQLAARFAASHSTCLFSATLSPWHFYHDTLGLPEQTAWIDVQSPFDGAQLSVQVARDISTRYRQRQHSLAPIADLIARQYRRQAGNYLAFFSSFDYLQSLTALFSERYPDIPVWQQTRQMDEAAREQFLARFTLDGSGIGFAVLGGSFAEGIDLPGRRLIGAFIATLGLPQINPVNQHIMQRMDAVFGAGYDYTYLYPGIQKVVQAAGRVIRTETDQGVVHLIDQRFTRPEVLALLPAWWRVR